MLLGTGGVLGGQPALCPAPSLRTRLVGRIHGGSRLCSSSSSGSTATAAARLRVVPRAETNRAAGGGQRGAEEQAELHKLLTRLREDDVEYFDLKALCKQWGLGGRDNKDNLRAKLMRRLREELGLRVFGPDSVPASSVRLPQHMTASELAHLFESRGCLMPTSHWQALSMANALLIADRLLEPEDVSWPDAPGEWAKLTVQELKQECASRKLPIKGLKEDLIQRLCQWDADVAREAAERVGSEAAAAEAGAVEGVAPSATNNSQLHAAQQLYSGMRSMEVGALRAELQHRGLPTQGTKQVLLAKLTESLEKDVAVSLGGERRLAQWAASAVARMDEAEVRAQLTARSAPMAPRASPADAAAALQALMAKDWVGEALHGPAAPAAAPAPAPEGEAEAWEAEAGAAGAAADAPADGYSSGEGYGAAAEAPAAAPFLSGRAGDPTLSVALLCGGHTLAQREASLAAARLAAHFLQSDPADGLVSQQLLADNEGAERSGIAVQAFYSAAGANYPLSWEQLHGVTAAELDVRLELQPGSAASPAELASADALLPLGPGAGGEALAAAAGGKLSGSSCGDAAACAADRLAFAERAQQLGFAAVPAMRLTLVELAAAAAAPTLGDLPAYQQLEAWAMEHLPAGAAPRLAVRAEVGGSVLGGCLVSGARNALLGAAALLEEHGVAEVVVEAVQPGAVHWCCSVLEGEQGAVALPPTQLDYSDIEDDIMESELALERFLALHEGLDAEGVDALLELLRQEQATHPGYLGGPASASQQLRQSTPPAGLSAEASEAIRQASVALFQRLGLRDCAQFSGWVLPPARVQRGAAPPAAAEQAGEPSAAQAVGQPGTPRSFAELLEVDAAERAAATGPPGVGISPADRATATDTTADTALGGGGSFMGGGSFLGGELAEAEAAAAAAAPGSTYGVYNGVVLDEATRRTNEEAVEEATGAYRPIPEGPPPEPVVEALPQLADAPAAQLCALRSGATVAFAQLSFVPDLGSPSSVLCQQGAAVGLSQEALLRHLVSAAAARGGAAPLPPLPEVTAAEEARAAAAAAAAADGAPAWRQFASLQRLDEPALAAFAEAPFVFASWLAQDGAAAGGDEQQAAEQQQQEQRGGGDAGGFQFVDATSDPSLDPVAQQAAWEAEQAATAGGLDMGYEEIRSGDPYEEVAAGVPYAEPGADWGTAVGSGADGATHLEHLHPTKQRVWVLLGGDGPQRTRSLQAGLHAYQSLRNNPELLVEAYLLEPRHAGIAEEERRRALLERRLDLLKLGLEDSEVLQENELWDLSRIRHPPPGETELLNTGVWRLSDSGLLRGEVEDLQCACEAALATANASLAVLEEAGGDLAAAQLSVARQELGLAGVALDGSAWGGDAALPESLTPAQYTWLRQFLDQAQDVGATVLLALGDQPAAHGPLQRLLEERGVPFTGSRHLAAETCADKAAMMEQLLDLEASGISTAPQANISLPELAAQTGSEAAAARLFEQLATSLGAGGGALCIKPAHAAGGLGVVRVAGGGDLALYARAVEVWADLIPGEALAEGGADVAMPMPPPSQFVVEPFVTTEPVQLLRAADGSPVPPASQTNPGAAPADGLASALHWPAGGNQWLAVTAVLVGEAGRMRCLGPSLRVLQLQERRGGAPAPGSAAAALVGVQRLVLEDEASEAETEEEAAELRAAAADAASAAAGAAAGAAPPRLVGSFELTPPPETLASSDAIASARVRLEMVADRLGLSGAAEVTAYVQAQTGEVVVSDVDTLPDLSPGAPIFRQAASSGSPLSPADVFLELVRIGLVQPLEEADGLQSLGYSDLAAEQAPEYDYPQDASYPAGTWGAFDMPPEYSSSPQQ